MQLWEARLSSLYPVLHDENKFSYSALRKALEDCLAQETAAIKYLWRHLLVNDL